MKSEEEKYRQMIETPIPRLITVLALPTILSMLVTSLYNMADTFFIGQIKDAPEVVTSATGAIAVVFSLMSIIQACGFFFGQGSGNFVSRALGNKDRLTAQKMATFGFFTSLIFGLLISVFGIIFLEPLAKLLGSTETILPHAKSYMFYILLGVPFMCASLVLNNQLRFQGNAFVAMIGIISGAVINVALDALFVLGLNMGTGGAGLATLIGQTCSFIILFVGVKLSNNVQIKIKDYRLDFFYFKEVFRGGTPSLARQGLSSISVLCLTHAINSIYPEAAQADPIISAMGIVSRIMMFCFSASLGFGQGFQPVCGYNYGAKKYSRVKEGFFFCLKFSTIFSFVISLVIFIFADKIVALFNDDIQVVKVGELALRVQSVSFQFVALTVFSNMMLQTIGKVFPATLLSMARQGLFYLPFVFTLPLLFDIYGIVLIQAIADVLSFVLALILTIKQIKELNRLENELKS